MIKNLTRFEKKVFSLSKKLPEINSKQMEYAKRMFSPVGMYWKKQAVCGECGCCFDYDSSLLINSIDGKKYVCPHCGAELEMKRSKYFRHDSLKTYTIAATIGGFQVFRQFEVLKCVQGKDFGYFYNEVVQNWIDESGKSAIVARKVDVFGFDLRSDLEIRRPRAGYMSYYDPTMRYEYAACLMYPYGGILPEFRKRGLSLRYKGNMIDACRDILNYPCMETVMKLGDYTLFNLGYGFLSLYWKQIKICIKNGYKFKDRKDWDMWADHIRLLKRLGKDVHNAKYICPKDLKSEHDYYLKIEARKKEQIEREKWLKNEELYNEQKKMFFGLKFENDNFCIVPLKSVEEFYREYKIMGHCVYSNEYYKKKESLIMHAVSADGKIYETIEIDLKRFVILQSRGIHNSNSKFHESIISLVNDNMNQIKKIAKRA